MADMLYDQPVAYFQHGCTTDGKFDPEKALARGYSEIQLPVIEAFLAGEPVGVAEPELPDETEVEVFEDDPDYGG